jgi:hypothetical protein
LLSSPCPQSRGGKPIPHTLLSEAQPYGISSGPTQTNMACPNASTQKKYAGPSDLTQIDSDVWNCPRAPISASDLGPKCIGPDSARVRSCVPLVRLGPSRQRQIASFSTSRSADTPLPPKPQPWRWTPPLLPPSPPLACPLP